MQLTMRASFTTVLVQKAWANRCREMNDSECCLIGKSYTRLLSEFQQHVRDSSELFNSSDDNCSTLNLDHQPDELFNTHYFISNPPLSHTTSRLPFVLNVYVLALVFSAMCKLQFRINEFLFRPCSDLVPTCFYRDVGVSILVVDLVPIRSIAPSIAECHHHGTKLSSTSWYHL